MAEAVAKAGADTTKMNFDQESGILSMEVNGSMRALSPATLFPDYMKLTKETDKSTFVSNVIKTYVSSTSGKPADFQSAMTLLKPRLQTKGYFRKKTAELPQGQSIPHCGLSGAPLTASASLSEIGVCVVVDLGHAIVPVLSGDLVVWGGRSFEDVLAIAITNLRKASGQSAGKGNPKTWKFGKHASACCQSEWGDQFDSTRAAVIPNMVMMMGPGAMAGAPRNTGGDPVVIFAAHSQCMAAGSKNPLSLCFMGDMTLDVVKKRDAQNGGSKSSDNITASNLTSVLLSVLPYRLRRITGKANTKKHPLHMPVHGSKTDEIYVWERYKRGEGEFSIPSNQQEIDAILEGTQTGKIPVFDESKDADGEEIPETADEKAIRIKGEGNALFSKKKWKDALAKYTEAIDFQPKNHILFGNRAMCRLKLSEQYRQKANKAEGEVKTKSDKQSKRQAELALEDATTATECNGHWSKGWARKGSALQALHRLEEAADALRIGLALKDLSANEKKALDTSLRSVTTAIEEEAKAKKEAEAKARQEQKEANAPPSMAPVYIDTTKFDMSSTYVPGLSGANSAAASSILGNSSVLGGYNPSDYSTSTSSDSEVKSIFSMKK